jgi:DNA (cytosine-5)-methyltransferase 1
MAGLKVIWGFDFNPHACATWRLNFPSATMYEMSAFDVCEIWAKEAKAGSMPNRAQVDILHISPPCQFFSPAHTIAGKDDEMNTASLLACGRLLALVKPRVVTLEQTFGIGHAEFTRWFNALIHQFTDNGYSLRWKICHLQDWVCSFLFHLITHSSILPTAICVTKLTNSQGLPQRRQRLIIIAACPGETLPPFPPYTHSKYPTPLNGLKPYTSVNTLLTSIPLGAPDHDLASSLAKPLHESPWDGTSIAPRAITTHGGQNYHPSGTRGFTNRELATLQGFPAGHRFGEKNVKKQIGNAVPPSVAAVLFKAVRMALEEADGVEREVFVVD